MKTVPKSFVTVSVENTNSLSLQHNVLLLK